MTPSRRAGLRSAVKSVVVTCVILLLVDFVLHWRYVRKLQRGHLPDIQKLSREAGIPADVLRSIGSFKTDGQDLRSVSIEHPGIVRLACIGDSFTFGEEVLHGLDYPSLLHEEFRKRGLENVETVNFGSSWTGLGQAYRFWDTFGRRYDPDFILLGPAFFSDRNQTFNHAVGIQSEYVHGRYVLEGNTLAFQDVIGNFDRDDIFDHYFSFIPEARYLRYDRRAPSFIGCLLPANRTIANPFYYSKLSFDDEAVTLERRLFRGFAESKPTVSIHIEGLAVEAAKDIPGLLSLSFDVAYGLPNRRAGAHLSAIGNRALASRYAQILMAAPAIRWKTMRWGSLVRTKSPSLSSSLLPYHSTELWSRSRVASLVWVNPDTEESVHFDDDHVAALLALSPGADDILDRPFYALAHSIGPKSKVILEIAGEKKASFDIEIPNAGLAIGVARVPGVQTVFARGGPHQSFPQGFFGFKIGQTARILIDDEPLAGLEPTTDGLLRLTPLTRRTAYFIPGPHDDLDIDAMPKRGIAELRLVATQPTVVPFVEYFVDDQSQPNDVTRLPKIIVTDGPNRAKIVENPMFVRRSSDH